MGTPEFPELGRHCSLPDCNLVDFLPFVCDSCKQVFCLEHRLYSQHGCPSAHLQSVEVFICPICAKSVRVIPDEDPNITWENHQRSNCDAANYAKITNKPKCPVRGCKETLSFSNKVTCKECKHEVCLKHRFGKDHDCESLRKSDKKPSNLKGLISRSFGQVNATQSGHSGRSISARTEALRSSLQSATLTAKSSLEAGLTRASATTSSIYKSMRGDQSKERNLHHIQGDREVCPQCGVHFSSVQQLIEHVSAYHPSSRSEDETIDICPKCGKKFSNPILLVKHVEHDHKGTSSDHMEKCIIS